MSVTIWPVAESVVKPDGQHITAKSSQAVMECYLCRRCASATIETTGIAENDGTRIQICVECISVLNQAVLQMADAFMYEYQCEVD